MTKKVDEPNTHKCMKGLWDKLSPFQKKLYNSFQEIPLSTVRHPKTNLSKEEWKTITHNLGLMAAWKSAEIFNELPITKIIVK